MGVLDNENRIGAISSSKAYLLVANSKTKDGFSAACNTYLSLLKREKRFTKSLSNEFYSRPVAWGNFCEYFVAEYKTPLDYKHLGDKTFTHKDYSRWAGTPDFVGDNTVRELKSYYPEKFTLYAEAIEKQDIEILKKEFPQEYWQIVSNSCVLDLKYGESCLFMPFFEDLNLITKSIEDYEGANIWEYRFIHEEILDNPENPKVPYIPKGSNYKDFNLFRFEIPKEDKEFLTERIEKAIKDKL